MDGVKYDNEKLRWDLFPEEAEKEIVEVLTYGAKKYDDENWRKVDNLKRRYFSAMRRHVSDWRLDERYDDESSFHHLAHAICCLMFILQLELEEKNETRNSD